jgi:hypothetical protein
MPVLPYIKRGVIRGTGIFRNGNGRRMGELIGVAYDKAIECKTRYFRKTIFFLLFVVVGFQFSPLK